MAEFRDQVVFNQVPKTYPIEAHVLCSYTMKSTHIPSSYDWIGLFKVGWANVNDFVFYIWAPFPKDKPADEDYQGSVLFQCKSL